MRVTNIYLVLASDEDLMNDAEDRDLLFRRLLKEKGGNQLSNLFSMRSEVADVLTRTYIDQCYQRSKLQYL